MPRGNTWDVVQRCLALLVCLTRGPATTDNLMEIVCSHLDRSDQQDRELISKRFEKDRQKLREYFGCEITFNKTDGLYTLNAMTSPLISLPPEAIRGLAFLRATFDDTAPMSHEIKVLISSISMLISEDERDDVEKVRGLIELDLRRRDGDDIPDKVWKAVQRACTSHRELEFEYLAASHEDRLSRLHRVEPERCYFDSMRSHYYLEAYCIENRGPEGTMPVQNMTRYRMGRIISAEVTPKRFVPGQRRFKTEELVYELSPEIVRGGITKHIENCEIELRDDGSAIVRAKSTNLFFDLRTLLHYGPNCRVIGGEEARKQMIEIVQKMSSHYLGN